MKKILVCLLAAGLGVGISPTAIAQTSELMAQEVARLREQVEALQRRLDQQAVAEAPPASTPGAGVITAASAPPAAQAATEGLHYKGVTLTLGGFVAAESIYRQHNEENDISTNFAAIPFENNSVGKASETRYTARQSRLSVLVQGRANEETHLAFYAEMDLQGGAQTANSVESNSYNPRLRHLYGTIDWDQLGLHVLAGQTWSLVTLNGAGITPRNEVAPPTIDGQYLPGFSWIRQSQLRVTKSFAGGLWAALSVENPQTTAYTGANALPANVHLVYSGPGGQGFDAANTLSINRVPDVVAKVAEEFTVAKRAVHLEVLGLFRNFYERLDYHNTSVNGEGVGAGLVIAVVPRWLDLEASGLVGKGIGRYGSALLPDVTFDGAGSIHPIHEVQMLAGLTLHATPSLDVFVFAGEERASAETFTLTGTGTSVAYGYGNIAYSNAGCYAENSVAPCIGNSRLIEQATAGVWYKPYVGSFGTVRYGMQFSRTERQAFGGLGGAPTATQNIALLSLRYYPF